MGEYYVEWISERMREFGMEFFHQTVAAEAFGARAHIHDSIEIIFVEEGIFHVFINEEHCLAGAGDVLLFRSNTIHSIVASSSLKNSYFVLKLKPELLMELASKKTAPEYLLRFSASGNSGKSHWSGDEIQKSGIGEAFGNLIREYQGEELCGDISLKIYSCHVILELLRDIIRNEQRTGVRIPLAGNAEEQIYHAITYIHRNLGENLNARMLSEMVNMSYSYFSRCFKRVTGRGFKEYLNEIRINYAEHLLMTTKLSVTQIASECGYNNVSYFTAVYKELKKGTPLSDRGKYLARK